jgi:hypothetical protein
MAMSMSASGDDDRVVAAELENRAAEPLADDLADAVAHLARAGRRDQRDALVVQQRSPTVEPLPMTSEKIAGVNAVLQRRPRSAILVQAMAVSGVLLEGFQSDAVAADGGDGGVPAPHGDREVERADDADDAERVPLLVHAVLRAARSASSGRRAAARGRGEVADVDHLLHFALALGGRILPISSVTSCAEFVA